MFKELIEEYQTESIIKDGFEKAQVPDDDIVFFEKAINISDNLRVVEHIVFTTNKPEPNQAKLSEIYRGEKFVCYCLHWADIVFEEYDSVIDNQFDDDDFELFNEFFKSKLGNYELDFSMYGYTTIGFETWNSDIEFLDIPKIKDDSDILAVAKEFETVIDKVVSEKYSS